MSRLGNIFNLIGGGTPSTKEETYWGKGTPWISSADISLDGKIIPRRSVTPRGIKYSTTNIVPKGTVIVVTRVGLGKVAKLQENTCFSQDIQALIPKDNSLSYSAQFLMLQLLYKMQSMKFQGQGTTISGITKKQLADVHLFLPTLPEQERIVAHIEELFSELDAGVETLKKTKAQLDVYRQAVLKEAFENQDTCSSHSLSELMLTVKNGYGIKPDDEGQYKILKISAVRAANLDLDEYRYNKMPFDNNYLIHENDLLFTRYNGSRELVGVCAAVPRLKTTYAYPDKIIKCTPKLQNTFHSKYIQYYLSQGEPRKYIRSKTKTTSGQHGISGSDLKKARIYLPSIAEQEDIVRKIESRLSVCNNIEQTIDATLEQAKALRHSILKEAFEGSLAQ